MAIQEPYRAESSDRCVQIILNLGKHQARAEEQQLNYRAQKSPPRS